MCGPVLVVGTFEDAAGAVGDDLLEPSVELRRAGDTSQSYGDPRGDFLQGVHLEALMPEPVEEILRDPLAGDGPEQLFEFQ